MVLSTEKKRLKPRQLSFVRSNLLPEICIEIMCSCTVEIVYPNYHFYTIQSTCKDPLVITRQQKPFNCLYILTMVHKRLFSLHGYHCSDRIIENIKVIAIVLHIRSLIPVNSWRFVEAYVFVESYILEFLFWRFLAFRYYVDGVIDFCHF